MRTAEVAATPERRLAGWARRGRLLASSLVLVALLAGTLWGDDRHFPFGPLRMYSVADDPNGTVSTIRLRGTTMSGERVEFSTRRIGLRPADVNGQANRLEHPGKLIDYLAEAYARFEPYGPLSRLELVRGRHQLRAGRPVAYEEDVLQVWRRR